MQHIPITLKTIESKNQSLPIPKKRRRIPMTMNFHNSPLFSNNMESHQLSKAASTTKSLIQRSRRPNHLRKRKQPIKFMSMTTQLKLRSNNPSEIFRYFSKTSKLK